MFFRRVDCTLYFDFLAWFDSSTVWSNAVTVMSIPNFWNKNGRMDLLGAVVFTLYATGVSVTFRTFKYRATCCVKGPTRRISAYTQQKDKMGGFGGYG